MDDTALTHDEHLTVSCSAMDSSIWNTTNELNTCSSLHFGILFGLRDFEGRTTEERNLPCLVVHNPFGNRLIESQLAPCCWNGPPGAKACWKKHNKNNQWRKLANCCGHVGQIYGHVEPLQYYTFHLLLLHWGCSLVSEADSKRQPPCRISNRLTSVEVSSRNRVRRPSAELRV